MSIRFEQPLNAQARRVMQEILGAPYASGELARGTGELADAHGTETPGGWIFLYDRPLNRGVKRQLLPIALASQQGMHVIAHLAGDQVELKDGSKHIWSGESWRRLQ
jgi:hypothetical protein